MSQAIMFTAQNQVKVQPYDPPELHDDELLVRTEYSGVSQGTEIWALIGKRPELQFPTLPGYQTVGVIERVGAKAGDYKPGQRVLWHRGRVPASYTETWMGGHVGLAAVPVANDPPPRVVPDEVDSVSAALAAMAAVSLRGNDMLDIRPGDLVVVAGQGLIGQTAAQLARLRGAAVIATDLSPTRLKLSAAHSADIAIDPRQQDVDKLVRSLRPAGADVVIDTTGRSAAFAECIGWLRWEGQFLMQGYYPDPVTFNFHATHMKKPKIAITCGIGDTGRILELLKYRKLNIKGLVTDLLPLNGAPKLYERLTAADPNILGVVFNWTEKH